MSAPGLARVSRNKLLTAAELLMPIYIILFLLLIRRLDVIPYRVDYTPAANAPARYSIFGPPTLGWVPEITKEQEKERDDFLKEMKMDTDALRIGVAPSGGEISKRVADGLCQFVANPARTQLGLKVEFSGDPCLGVKMYPSGEELYRLKGRFDKTDTGVSKVE